MSSKILITDAPFTPWRWLALTGIRVGWLGLGALKTLVELMATLKMNRVSLTLGSTSGLLYDSRVAPELSFREKITIF